mgnify:FL=1
MLREIDAHSGNRLSGSLPLKFVAEDVIDGQISTFLNNRLSYQSVS